MNKIFKYIKEVFENKSKLIKIIIVFVGLGQLSFSQVHIALITKFTQASSGIILFLVLLCSLICIFRVTKIDDGKSNILKSIQFNCLTIFFTGIYIYIIYSELINSEFVTTDIIKNSLVLSLTTVFLLISASIFSYKLYKSK